MSGRSLGKEGVQGKIGSHENNMGDHHGSSDSLNKILEESPRKPCGKVLFNFAFEERWRHDQQHQHVQQDKADETNDSASNSQYRNIITKFPPSYFYSGFSAAGPVF